MVLILLSAIHDNYPTLMVYLEEGYNKFLAESSTISAIRSSAWILKICAEVLVPIWNFIIDTTKKVFINVLKLVLSDMDAKDYAREIFSTLAKRSTTWQAPPLRGCRLPGSVVSSNGTTTLSYYP